MIRQNPRSPGVLLFGSSIGRDLNATASLVWLSAPTGYSLARTVRHGRWGSDANTLLDNSARRDDRGCNASHGSTLRPCLPLLHAEVGMGRQQYHVLLLYVMGSVQGDCFRAFRNVPGKSILVTGASGGTPCSCRRQEEILDLVIHLAVSAGLGGTKPSDMARSIPSV